MSRWIFDVPAWPPGDEWPAGMLPPPVVTLEIGCIELETLIAHHDEYAREWSERDKNGEDYDHTVELFHIARASYLRQRLAIIAPHRLTPDRKGTA